MSTPFLEHIFSRFLISMPPYPYARFVTPSIPTLTCQANLLMYTLFHVLIPFTCLLILRLFSHDPLVTFCTAHLSLLSFSGQWLSKLPPELLSSLHHYFALSLPTVYRVWFYFLRKPSLSIRYNIQPAQQA